METKNGGLAAKIEMAPLGWDGWAQLAEPTPKDAQEGGKANGYQPQTLDDLEDSVPF
jgi:hypothetical protein